ncbi:hypothetical protein AXE65_04720 [Ventosimonas gracilis]|uniref:Serine/threonine protein kinase n=1 Tax=Ventosimonas gracilis TaxID=1680762 RepID=A0A139SQE5_9GAMM|nr:DEAD/DEAH box helicase [Ventosimonas gracilis]KXU36796.1 hypothetical protein AXE65_04720 [Ventosimonas gracilis]
MPSIKQPSLNDFSALPATLQAVLLVLALAPSGLTRTEIGRTLRVLGVKLDGKPAGPTRLEPLLKHLSSKGWLAGFEIKPAYPFRLLLGLHNTLLCELTKRPDWLVSLTLSFSSHWGEDCAYLEQALWIALLDNKMESVQIKLRELMRRLPAVNIPHAHPLPLLLADDDGQALLSSFPAAQRALLVCDWLEQANQFLFADTSGAYSLALELYQQSPSAKTQASLAQQLLLQCAWRGDWQALESFAQLPQTLELAEFFRQLLTGYPQEALFFLQTWQKTWRKHSGQRKADLPKPLEALRLFALISSGDAAHLASADKALKTLARESSGGILLRMLLQRLQGQRVPMLETEIAHLLKMAEPWGAACLMALLAVHWLGQEASSLRSAAGRWRSYFKQAGFDWLAAEFDALLIAHGMDGDKALADWHARHGFKPLHTLYSPREAWQHALEALAHIHKPAVMAAPAVQTERRLAWFLHADETLRVEPREQKINSKGQWSKGRVVALQRLQQASPEEFDYLLPQDQQIAACIEREPLDYFGNQRHYLDANRALPHLVDHPHLYLAEAPDVRIDLIQGEPSLHVTQQGEQVRLQLEPAELAHLPPHGLLLENETPTRFKLYQCSDDIRRIAAIIGEGLTVPASAKEQLSDAISAIAPMLPVHADVPELAAHMETIDSDATLYAHLLPLAEGLRLQLLVRPQASGSWFRPGQGAANLACEQDGKPVQIRRNLLEERVRLHHVLDHCPALAGGAGDGHEWRFDNASDALQLLSELHALEQGKVQCVWPEGERMRIRARGGMGSMRLSVQRQGDWFALQGEMTLDNGRVLQLKQLLDLLRESEGSRFVPLGEGDWLALTDDLRRRLADVAHLADKIDENGARLSTLAAPLLEALSAEAGEFSADAAWQEQVRRLQSLREFTPQVPRLLQAELRDYQREGFVWLARLAQWGVGACLADDMGLGKTVQLLALLLHRAALGPQLVVAPTSVVGNWQAEAQRFAPSLQLIDYRQTRSLEALKAGDLVLCSYGLLQSEQEAFAAQNWASVVLDEAQAVKNAQTKRSQAVMALCADFRVIASGTPLENHLGELWNLMRFINPGLLGSQQRFTERFAQPIELGSTLEKQQAKRALKQLIQPFILRRLKSEVLDELPPITEITHKIPLTDDERHQYEALRLQAVEELSRGDLNGGDARFKALAQITRLRRFCCHPSLVLAGAANDSSKLQALLPILDELRDNGHRALIFSQFVDHLSIVRRHLDQAGILYQYLDGQTPPKQRSQAVNAFQEGEGDVFLISLKAGGSGLNLTAADYVIHLDPWWNPAVEDQAAGRAHRIGQQRPVTVYRLVAESTIEEQIVALHAHKRDLADSLLEGGEISARLDAEALLQLIRQP